MSSEGKLVKYAGVIEHMNKNTLEWRTILSPTWNKGETYRAKQKSERELFIEAVNEVLSNTALMPLPYAEMLFISGKFELKAPKAGE